MAAKVKNNLKYYFEREKVRREKENPAQPVYYKQLHKEVAAAVGMSYEGLRTLLKGYASPSYIVAYKLARYFNTTVEAIFTVEGE